MTPDYLERLKRAAHSAELRLADLIEHREHHGYRPVKATPKLHVPALNLADYVAIEAAPPPAVHRSNDGYAWGVLRNDSLGDCGEAMAIHADEAFHLDAGTPVPPWADEDAVVAYEEVGGYNPNAALVNGQNPTDQGTDNNVLVQRWKSPGLLCGAEGKRHTIAGSLFVDPADQNLSRIAIWEFVALFRAIALPMSAQTQGTHWEVTDPSLQGGAAPASWGYHDNPYLSYDDNHIVGVDWGADQLIDWDFDKAYAVGGFVVITQEQLNNQGTSPSGVNWTALTSDLAKLPAAPAA